MSENWVGKNMFCPCCGNSHIFRLKNNEPVADMRCDNCGEIFELKSKEGKIGKKINDGAYSTMMRSCRIFIQKIAANNFQVLAVIFLQKVIEIPF